MSQKSWQLDRRMFLRGTGVALALPMLDGMSFGAESRPNAKRPRRMCAVYFPYGVSLPPKDHEHAGWSWFPRGTGSDFEFTNILKSLEPLRRSVTVLAGLSHPSGRSMGGHDSGDVFLTGAGFKGSQFGNSVSVDQTAAIHFGDQTRFPSLALSTDGGVGEPTRSSTLSFSRSGRPVPAQSVPRQIFDRLFGNDSSNSREERRALKNSESMLDLVLDHARSVRRRLGSQDQRKFDEYLSSVRAIEQRVERSQRWLDVPKPNVDPQSLNLDSNPDGPQDYIRTMYDLLFLSFQTDTSRIATYQIGSMNGATSLAGKFPTALGLGTHHSLAHGAGKKGGFERQGRYDQFLAEQLAYFLNRLNETSEGDVTLLDQTMVFYGSSNSRTHNNSNYPLLLAGGNGLGLKHNQSLQFSARTPLSNLFVTMLDRLNVPVDSFSDSTGEMSELCV